MEIISQDEVSLDTTDFTSLLSRIQSNEPDVVWAVQTSSSGAGNLARRFSEAGFEDTHFFSTTNGRSPMHAKLQAEQPMVRSRC